MNKPVKRGRGRPKGSKGKPKVEKEEEWETTPASTSTKRGRGETTPASTSTKRGRGRPKGSKNKPKTASIAKSNPRTSIVKRGRGRPKGSKNKPKIAVLEQQAYSTASTASVNSRVSVLIAQEDTLQSCMSDEAMVTESDAHEYGLQQVPLHDEFLAECCGGSTEYGMSVKDAAVYCGQSISVNGTCSVNPSDQSCQQDNLTDEQQDACHLTGGQASEYAASVTDDAEGRGIGGECCSM